MEDKIYITYNKFGELANELCDKIRDSNYTFSSIYGLPRGGMVLAVHLSFNLELPIITNLMQFKSTPDSRLLIVDDIIGLGCGYERAIEFCDIKNIQYSTAVLFDKSDTDIPPHFIIDKISSWVVFPWDNPVENGDVEYATKININRSQDLVFKEAM